MELRWGLGLRRGLGGEGGRGGGWREKRPEGVHDALQISLGLELELPPLPFSLCPSLIRSADIDRGQMGGQTEC